MELIVRHRGETVRVSLDQTVDEEGPHFAVTIDDRRYRVDWRQVGAEVRSLLIGGRQHEVAVRHAGDGDYEVSGAQGAEKVKVMELLAHLAESSHDEVARAGRHQVPAYMPGRVVQLLVDEGAEVVAGQGILVLEAMKMENEIQAEQAGIVRKLLVEPGEAVEGGDPLYEIES